MNRQNHNLPDASVKLNKTQTNKWNAFQQNVEDKSVYTEWIDHIDCPAGTKNLLKKLVDKSVIIGKRIYQFGKFVLSALMKLCKLYPRTVIGAVIGLFIATIISSIPIVGTIIGPLAIPILIALGGIEGFYRDLNSRFCPSVTVEIETVARQSF